MRWRYSLAASDPSRISHVLVSDDDSVHSSSQPLNFNFGDSPLSPEWRERITAKLSSIPEVFAKHDLDFGKTDKVTHRIKLSDETPFKQISYGHLYFLFS